MFATLDKANSDTWRRSSLRPFKWLDCRCSRSYWRSAVLNRAQNTIHCYIYCSVRSHWREQGRKRRFPASPLVCWLLPSNGSRSLFVQRPLPRNECMRHNMKQKYTVWAECRGLLVSLDAIQTVPTVLQEGLRASHIPKQNKCMNIYNNNSVRISTSGAALTSLNTVS
jgi:hypothetical protein